MDYPLVSLASTWVVFWVVLYVFLGIVMLRNMLKLHVECAFRMASHAGNRGSSPLGVTIVTFNPLILHFNISGFFVSIQTK